MGARIGRDQAVALCVASEQVGAANCGAKRLNVAGGFDLGWAWRVAGIFERFGLRWASGLMGKKQLFY